MALQKVNSASLAHALDAAASRVKRFTETLDAISDDIKTVEKWLQQSGARVEVEVAYYDNGYYIDGDDGMSPTTAMDLGTFPVRGETRKITWGPSPDGKTWRIMHHEFQHRGWFDEGDVNWTKTETVDVRPLIETPMAIRLALGDALAKLVEEIACKIPDYIEQTAISGDLSISDLSQRDDGPGPWCVSFRPGPGVESITGQQVFDRWGDVHSTVSKLVGTDTQLKDLAPGSYGFQRLKVPVKLLREMKLM
jgi:hypothetical protein